jgi:hypothetical protein
VGRGFSRDIKNAFDEFSFRRIFAEPSFARADGRLFSGVSLSKVKKVA